MFEYRFDKVNKFLDYLVKEEGFDPEYLRNNCVNDVGVGPVFVNLRNEYGFNVAFEFSDVPIVRCRSLVAEGGRDDDPKLLSFVNELTAKYLTHHFCVTHFGQVVVYFIVLFSDENFVPEDLYGCYEGVSDLLARDIPALYDILGQQLPKTFENALAAKADKDASDALGE